MTWVWVNSRSWWWDRKAWHAAVHGGHKESDTTERLNWMFFLKYQHSCLRWWLHVFRKITVNFHLIVWFGSWFLYLSSGPPSRRTWLSEAPHASPTPPRAGLPLTVAQACIVGIRQSWGRKISSHLVCWTPGALNACFFQRPTPFLRLQDAPQKAELVF